MTKPSANPSREPSWANGMTGSAAAKSAPAPNSQPPVSGSTRARTGAGRGTEEPPAEPQPNGHNHDTPDHRRRVGGLQESLDECRCGLLERWKEDGVEDHAVRRADDRADEPQHEAAKPEP